MLLPRAVRRGNRLYLDDSRHVHTHRNTRSINLRKPPRRENRDKSQRFDHAFHNTPLAPAQTPAIIIGVGAATEPPAVFFVLGRQQSRPLFLLEYTYINIYALCGKNQKKIWRGGERLFYAANIIL
jgi:hypothetical protein